MSITTSSTNAIAVEVLVAAEVVVIGVLGSSSSSSNIRCNFTSRNTSNVIKTVTSTFKSNTINRGYMAKLSNSFYTHFKGGE